MLVIADMLGISSEELVNNIIKKSWNLNQAWDTYSQVFCNTIQYNMILDTLHIKIKWK